MRIADSGIEELQKCVDTLIVIPNQNLFRIANDKTTFADAFGMADQVLYSGVACITDLMVKEGLINLDFADVRSVMREMGKAMMGTGEASGEGRAMAAAEAAIANPLLDETSMKGAQGLLISITGGRDLTLFEVDEAATRIREEVDPDANIILGATFDEELEGVIRVSVVATGIDREAAEFENRHAELRQMARPAARSAAMPSRQAAPAPAAAPAAAAQKADPIADTIRTAEVEADAVPAVAQNLEKAAAGQEDEGFRPQSRLFTAPRPAEAPAPVRAPAAAPSVDTEAAEPRVRERAEHARMPNVEDFPPVVQAEMERKSAPAAAHHQDERGAMGLLKRNHEFPGPPRGRNSTRNARPAGRPRKRAAGTPAPAFPGGERLRAAAGTGTGGPGTSGAGSPSKPRRRSARDSRLSEAAVQLTEEVGFETFPARPRHPAASGMLLCCFSTGNFDPDCRQTVIYRKKA